MSSPLPPQPQQTVVEDPPELKEAKEKFNRREMSFSDLVKFHKRLYTKRKQQKLDTPDVLITLPLSNFHENPAGKGGIVFADPSETKPLPIVDQNKVSTIKNIDEALDKLRSGVLNLQEYRTTITNIGTVNSGTLEDAVAFWVPAVDARPGTKTNKSRNGFKYDSYHHPKGMFYQGVVKKAILAAISMAHKDWQKRYDKDAFVYDDPNLIYLDRFLKKYIDEHIPINAPYRDYHLEIYSKVIDLLLGTAKEDIAHRVILYDLVNTFCGKVMLELTPTDQEHFDLWCHK